MKNKEKYASKEKEKAKEIIFFFLNCMVASMFFRRCGSYMI